jgi:hypothetical protein
METTEITQVPQQPTAPAQVNIPDVLTQQQGLQVLIDAAKVAQSKGVFSLDDAELVNKAIKAFIPKTDATAPAPEGPVSSTGN